MPYKMTRDQRRMRSGYVGAPTDWSICNSHWLWAVDARVAEPSRRKSALPPRLLSPNFFPAGHPGISCRGNCRIDRLGCDDAMVACRADRRRKMTHDPSSFFNVPRGGVEHLATYGHRGRTIGSRSKTSRCANSCHQLSLVCRERSIVRGDGG